MLKQSLTYLAKGFKGTDPLQGQGGPATLSVNSRLMESIAMTMLKNLMLAGTMRKPRRPM